MTDSSIIDLPETLPSSCGPIEFTDDLTMLYRLYDKGGILLRVGITRNLLRRMSEYSEDEPWWDHVTRKTAEFYATHKAAEAAESAAIRAEGPLHNYRYNNWERVAQVGGNYLAAQYEAGELIHIGANAYRRRVPGGGFDH